MSANFFTVKPYDDSIGLSTMLDLYNKTISYLNPEIKIEITEELALIAFGKDTVFTRDFLIFKNVKEEVVGFAGVSKLTIYKDVWFVIYGILPEYFESELPGKMIDAILALIKDRGIPELLIQTIGDLSAPIQKRLDNLGFKPVHYSFSMILENFEIFDSISIPHSIVIKNQKEIDDYATTVNVINEAFKDAFKFKPLSARKWKRMQEALRKKFLVEYSFAFEKEKIVGLCDSYYDSNQVEIGVIGDLSVLPDHQHHKIGSALLASGIEVLRKKGCSRINLKVESQNEKALKLYEKFGFYQNRKLTEKIYQII